jgi:hypothetical protein
MSIYVPTFLNPDGESIDLGLDQIFSCQVNGSMVNQFELIIYELTNTVLYDSGIVMMGETLGNGETLNIILPMGSVAIHGDLKYTIMYSDGTTAVTSRQAALSSYSNSTIELPVPAVIGTKSYTFVSTYYQSQAIGVNNYQYFLYDYTGSNVIDSSGIISNSSLSYMFDGLISGNSYYVECIIVNDLEYSTDSGLLGFSVQYDMFGMTPAVSTTILQSQSAIEVDFGNAVQIIGNWVGGVTFVPNYLIPNNYGLRLADVNSSVTFKVPIPALFQYHTFWNPMGFTKGTILSFDNGAYSLSYDGTKFIMQNAGAVIEGMPITLNGIYLIAVRSLSISIFQNNVLLQNLNYEI